MSPKKKYSPKKLVRHGGWFTSFARVVATLSGKPATFCVAALVIVCWGFTGPLFGYSDTWQLVINTGTTIVTFLMVFLIQNTQNRDTQALQLKLDELIRSVEGAHTALIDLEELTDSELQALKGRYLEIAARGRSALRQGETDTGRPLIEP